MLMNMEDKRKKRFQFKALRECDAAHIDLGASCEDARAIQIILLQTGFLGRYATPGILCEETCAALAVFQRTYRLPPTGIGDHATLEFMERPRCGVPDIDPTRGILPAPFATVGCKQPRLDLTYAFLNTTPDLEIKRQRGIIADAFATWANVTLLSFREVDPADAPTFTLAWDSGAHPYGRPFNTTGAPGANTLAYASYPAPYGGQHAGSVYFDDAEHWTDEGEPGGVRLLNVAIHEIGHLLGLAHSNDPDSIMYPVYAEALDGLSADDIAVAQQLYGSP